MNAQLEAELIECLDALAQGESLERILARYPQDAAHLRPLLETAASLPALRMEPSEAAKLQSRQEFIAQAGLRRTAPRKAMGFLPRFATGFVAAALVAGVLGTGAVAASGSALPGDPLYNLKRAVEDVRLTTAGDPAQRQELQQEFEQRRIDEANELLDARRESEVEFSGTIEVIQPRAWVISGLVVQLDANTQIEGTPKINRLAEIRGVTGPNGLRASSISIKSSGETEMTATPVATEIPQATETPEPTKTATPTPTPRPQPAATIEPQPKATLEPQPAPTTAPHPEKTQEPTAVPQPTETAEPMATPQPVELEFAGNVNAMDAGTWTIDGTAIIVDNNTQIRNNINLGQRVKVKALRFADNRLVAVSIELSSGGDDGNSNSNDQQNSNENQNSHNDNSNNNENTSNENHNGDSNHNGNDNENRNGNGNENENENGH